MTPLPVLPVSKALTEADFQRAAELIGCDVPAIKAVADVEAPRGGFLPDGRPVTLFEAHIFYRETKGKYAATHPHLCVPKWDRKLYAKTLEGNWDRLTHARALDRVAADRSASWGRFQIMGFNHRAAGFDRLDDFVAAMAHSEGRQLAAFVAFLKSEGLAEKLRRHEWGPFAHGYNGPAYRDNQYDVKLAAAWRKHTTGA